MSSDSRRRLGAITALVVGLFVGLTLLPFPLTGPFGHCAGREAAGIPGRGGARHPTARHRARARWFRAPGHARHEASRVPDRGPERAAAVSRGRRRKSHRRRPRQSPFPRLDRRRDSRLLCREHLAPDRGRGCVAGRLPRTLRAHAGDVRLASAAAARAPAGRARPGGGQGREREGRAQAQEPAKDDAGAGGRAASGQGAG